MKTIYSTTVEFQTKLFTTRRTLWFGSVEDRLRFEEHAAVLGAVRVDTNIEHVQTVKEAMTEISNEILRCAEIAEGRAS